MLMRSVTVPFSLKLPDESSGVRGRKLTKAYQVRGVARLEGDRLTLEWSGSVEITEVNGGDVRTLRESVPAQRLVLPLARIASIVLHGWWWRPYILLRATGVRPLDLVPTATAGSIQLHLARRDRRAGEALVSQVMLAIGDATNGQAGAKVAESREPSTDR
jgi:hypothetical protein